MILFNFSALSFSLAVKPLFKEFLLQPQILLGPMSSLNISKKFDFIVRARSVVSDSLWPHGLYSVRILCPRNSPGKNTGVGCHFLLQGIFPTHVCWVPALASRFFTTEPPGKALASTDLFIVSVGLHFPECYIIGIIYRGTIPDWLLLLSNIHLSFHSSSWLDSPFLFRAE